MSEPCEILDTLNVGAITRLVAYRQNGAWSVAQGDAALADAAIIAQGSHLPASTALACFPWHEQHFPYPYHFPGPPRLARLGVLARSAQALPCQPISEIAPEKG